jgi:hypothetical protein
VDYGQDCGAFLCPPPLEESLKAKGLGNYLENNTYRKGSFLISTHETLGDILLSCFLAIEVTELESNVLTSLCLRINYQKMIKA